MSLPTPNQQLLAHSHKTAEYIRNAIKTAGGAIPFDEFMEHALYAPELGYYTAGICQLENKGDFTTAPEISSLFSHCVANQCRQIIDLVSDSYILELGAGSGIMAKEILTQLAQQKTLPQGYLIYELSPALRERQYKLIQEQTPQFLPYITWLEELPKNSFNGIIIANEVLDAMPVKRFYINADQIQECYVTFNDSEFIWKHETASAALRNDLINLKNNFEFDEEYYSEINLNLHPLLNKLSSCLKRGLILFLDYGYPQAEYYHPQRNQGTLQCYFQNHRHENPLLYPGIQDITAHVDFSAVANIAVQKNLEIAGYTSQAAFLLGCGLEKMLRPEHVNPKNTEFLSSPKNAAGFIEPSFHGHDEYFLHQLQLNTQVKILTLPTEMGEIVKAIALTKGLKPDLIGFSLFDRRTQL